MAFIQLTLYSNNKEILVNTGTITTIMDKGTHRIIKFNNDNYSIAVNEYLEVIKEMVGNL